MHMQIKKVSDKLQVMGYKSSGKPRENLFCYIDHCPYLDQNYLEDKFKSIIHLENARHSLNEPLSTINTFLLYPQSF
jgi:hypothetical protein